jgi:uncharacterized cupredoxin-like copper-binding protein
MMRARVAAVAILVMAAAALPACGGGPRAIRIDMRFSRYTPAALNARAGETVRFELVNDDPITHEFILGDAALQDRFERAPDEDHDGKAGQATLHPGQTKVIEYRFGSVGTLLFACHRPGHYAYGMRGTIHIKN